MTGILYYDGKTGKLMEGLVWELDIWHLDTAQGELVYGTPADSQSKEEKTCPFDKRHVTESRITKVTLDLFGGKRLGSFVPAWGFPIVSEAFARQLQDSRLSGYSVRPIVEISCNQSDFQDPRLYYLDCANLKASSCRWKVNGAPNLCPHCRTQPMVCQGCGDLNIPRCLNCGKGTLFCPESPEYHDPMGFQREEDPDKWVVEGKEWDGRDFFRAMVQGYVGPFVSNRAKEWMERTHTHPIAFKPALLNIEGMEDKFKVK